MKKRPHQYFFKGLSLEVILKLFWNRSGEERNVQAVLKEGEKKKHHICVEDCDFILAMNSKELNSSKAVCVGISFTSTEFNYQGHNCF